MKFQGDIVIVEVPSIPSTATRKEPENGRHIVAHSETGHHHFVNAADAVHFQAEDPNVCYLQMLTDSPVVHDRAWDTHAPQMLDGGKCYIGIRQVEKSPEGWRRVAD
ncbi:MAG: hypothetical protein NW202_13580 [Nitrospira sp.]|nr:hypothetical protein [Nitrospira sp.]